MSTFLGRTQALIDEQASPFFQPDWASKATFRDASTWTAPSTFSPITSACTFNDLAQCSPKIIQRSK